MFDKLLGVIAPHSCCGCQKTGAVLCEHCKEGINSEPSIYCLVCERPAVSTLCQPCRRRSDWTDAWVVGQREGVLKRLIDLYKFERVMAADEAIASLIAGGLPDLPSSTVCTFVPTSPAHSRRRGYDHMQRIARRVAQLKGIPCLPLLSRRTDAAQVGSGRKQRLELHKDSFTTRPQPVSGPILLLDDIYTTGATARAATAALRETYDQPIYLGIVARQPSRK